MTMINSMHNTQVATAPSCSRLDRGVELGYAMRLGGRNNAISGAATGGFWAFDPKTTKHHHSQRERTT